MFIEVGEKYKVNNVEYQVIRRIKNGGFGTVYLVKDNEQKNYALKVIQSNVNPKFQDSFNNEVKTAINLQHEYIVDYVNFEFIGSDALFLIMEYADGGTLEDELKEREKNKLFYTFDEQIKKFTNLAKAMKYLSASIVHRDIKPSNILIKDGKLMITDFGLAKLAEENTRSMTFKGFGTIKYIAPEAWLNQANTIQMDIYSMGIVFYEIATLNYPYEVNTPFNEESFKNAHLYSTIIDPVKYNKKINPKIVALLRKMLEKSLSQRFNNWDEILSIISLDQEEEDPLLNEAIKKRNEIDFNISLETQKRLEEEKRKQDLFNLVKYNFENLIINPLNKFVEQFNKSYPSGKILINSRQGRYTNELQFSFTTPSQQMCEIKMEVVNENSQVEHYKDFFDRQQIRYYTPKFRGSDIIGWGLIEFTSTEKGYNLVLIKDQDFYGELYLLENDDYRTMFINDKHEYLVYAMSALPGHFKRIIYSENLYLKNVFVYDNKHLIKLLNMHI